MLKLGSTDINKAYLGSTEINKIYLGDAEVFGEEAPLVPVNTVLPSISGFPLPGDKQTISLGTWTNSPSSYSVAVKKNGSAYSTITTAPWEFTPILADGGATFTVEVTATNGSGSSSPAVSDGHLIVSNVYYSFNPLAPGGVTIPDADTFISAINDQSGNANNASSSGSARPTFTGTINGNQAITFDGVNDLFSRSHPTTCSVYYVVSANAAAVAPNVGMTIIGGSSSGHLPLAQDGSASTSITLNCGTPTLRLNGSTIAPATRNEMFDLLYNAGTALLFEAVTVTGTTLNRIASGPSNFSFGGKMGRMVVLTGTPSDDERNALYAAFSDEWDLGFFNPDPGGGTGTEMTSGDGTFLTWGDGTETHWSGEDA